jgi:DMSO reductase anchor subunit
VHGVPMVWNRGLPRAEHAAMSFETWLLVNLVVGSFGLAYFVYGKKQSQPVPLVCGICLMVYGYMVDSLTLTILIGLVLIVIPFVYRPSA